MYALSLSPFHSTHLTQNVFPTNFINLWGKINDSTSSSMQYLHVQDRAHNTEATRPCPTNTKRYNFLTTCTMSTTLVTTMMKERVYE